MPLRNEGLRMPTAIFRIFSLALHYKGRLIVSQLGMLVAAVCIVAFASLISPLVNEGMVAGDAVVSTILDPFVLGWRELRA